MNRTTGIVIALFMAIVCTVLIYVSASRKVASVSRTEKVLQATQFVPAGAKIAPGMFKAVDVPQQVAQGLATGDVSGQFAKVPILKDQYLMKDALAATGRDPGYVEVYVPVDVPSSACVISGDYVDVYTRATNDNQSALLYSKAKVLNVVDQNSKETEPGGKSSGVASVAGSSTAAAVGIAVPSDQAIKIVGPASQKQIYLVKSAM